MRISDWSSDVGSSYLRFNKSQTSLLVRGFPAGPILQASGSFRATTWNVSALYKIDPDVSLYATVRRGYRAGGFNPAASTPELLAYRPETVTDYEIGVKSRWEIEIGREHVCTPVTNEHIV